MKSHKVTGIFLALCLFLGACGGGSGGSGSPDTSQQTPANQAPTVSAGPDQVAQLTSAVVSLHGTVTDDGLSGSTLVSAWSVVSGPAAVVFGDSAAVDTTASFSVVGSYVLRLTADDGEHTASDEVTILIQAPINQPPTVSAGADQAARLPSAIVTLDGNVIDDGLPGTTLVSAWSVVSGPAAVVFGNSAAVDTTASFSVIGTYVLRLTADDGVYKAGDELTVLIQPPLNQPPTVTAGESQAAMLPYTVVSLDGTVTDDGLPGGGLVSAWSVVSGPAAVVFGDNTAVDTTANFLVAGTYVLRLTADDGGLKGSDDVTVVISDDASYLDTFDSDTTASYTLTRTVGVDGSLSYDPDRKQAWVQTGNDNGLQISKTLAFVDRGVFSLVFEPTVNYPSGGSIYLRLKEDDNNYLEIKNTDGYGPGYLHKVVGGALVDTADFRSEYSQGAAYEIFVYFTPQATMVEGFDQTVAITADPTSLTINSFEIELRQQDAYLDNIALQNLRYSKLVNLRDGYWQNTTDLPVKVIAANLEPGWAVRFTLDDSVSAPRVFEQPVSGGPFLFETVFAGIPKTEYRLDTEVLDENSLEILDAELIDAAVPVTIGDYYISVGASMARGSHDDIFYDNVSADGRDSGGGFGPILNDLLTAAKGYPHTVPSEGVSGHTTLDGMDVIDSVLVKHPYARYVLLLYGTNDAQLVPPTPDGLGLPPGHVDYPGSYKANMQAIIDVIVSDGKFPYLAKLPIAYGPFAGLNPQLQKYNAVLDELATENGIQVVPPDLYSWFETHSSEIDTDGLHPNGLGYQSIATLWRDAILAAPPPP